VIARQNTAPARRFTIASIAGAVRVFGSICSKHPLVAQMFGSVSKYDRVIIVSLLVGLTLFAWAYTAHQANLMHEMGTAMGGDMDMPMNGPPSWSPLDALLVLVMWAVMMAAMMVPGTSPMVTAFATINRRRREREAPYVPTVLFLTSLSGPRSRCWRPPRNGCWKASGCFP